MIRAKTAPSKAEKHRLELAAVVSSSGDAILATDLTGIVEAWNKGAQDLYGYTAGDMIGQTIATVIPEHLHEEHLQSLRDIVARQPVACFETVRKCKDGRLVPVSLIVSPVRNSKGDIIGASTIAHDITERKRADEVRERLAAVLDSSDDAIIGMTLDGAITTWNRGAENLFGYSTSEAVGKPIGMLLPAERANEESEILARIRRGERIEHFETVRVQKDGRRVDVSVTISPIRDRSGVIIGGSKIARDITERKRVEEELRKSEERFSKAFRSSPLAVTISTQAEGRYVDVNDAFLQILGYKREDVIGSTASNLNFWAQPSQRTEMLQLLEVNGRVMELRTQFKTSTGELREAEVSAELIEVEGQPCVLAITRDITERMRSEERLREYERVVEGLEDMIVVVDREYRYVIANRAFLNYRDVKREQVVGYRVNEVLGNATFESVVKEKIDECFGGKVVQYELSCNYSRLGERALFVSYFPIAGPTGIERIACVLRDITERKRAEEKLRKSEDRFSKAFHQSPLSITISTVAEGRFLDANESFLKMAGYVREDVIGHTFSELKLWTLPSLRLELLRQLKEGGSVKDYRMQYRTSTAEIREAELSWEQIEVDEQPCLLAFMRDVTETLSLEAQFQQAQKMEAVGRLAGGVAHDFNNMLSVIIGYCDLSIDQVGPEAPVKKHLAQIKKASERAALLTRQLLAFSRQEVIFPRILNLNDVAHNVTSMLLRMVGEDVSISFRPATPMGSIKADPGQIEQVLMNLVVNARDAMPSGGEIIIETGHADLDENYVSQHVGSGLGQHVVLTISDTGCGMDESIKSKIFEPFFTTKGSGRGTGLGLSTVYGIVTLSKGSIFVDSQPGKGTTFKIYFPRIAAKAEGLVQSSEVDELPRGSETILVVDDDDAVRKVAASLLSSAGYRIIEASNAEKALKIMTTLGPRIDLLLTDLIMFGKSGVELAEQAKAIHGYLPVLFMSGYAGDLLASRRGLLSEQAFVAKPFTRTSLLNMVYSALHRE